MPRSDPRRPVRWQLQTLLALMILPALAGCDDEADSPMGASGETTVSVYLTDAPGDVDSVWVQVDAVTLVGTNGSISVLDEPTELVNLTELTHSAIALAEDVEIEPGLYTQVRFVLGSAVLLASNGTAYGYGDVDASGDLEITGTLTCPSCSQSGIKVRFPGGVDVSEGDDAGLLIDFDVSQSFGHEAGHSGRWVMHPTLLGSIGEADDVDGGAGEGQITGQVSLAQGVVIPMCGDEARDLEDFVPLATATTLMDGDGLALAFSGETDADGSFEIKVLDADTYTLGYEAQTDFGAEMLVWQADVDPLDALVARGDGDVGGVTYTVTGVTCPPTP